MKAKVIVLYLLLFCIYYGSNAQQVYQSCFGKESTKWTIVKPTSYWGIENESILNYYIFDSIKCYGWYDNEQSDGLLYYETDDNSKLWRWETQTGKKSLVMDLNWQVGDKVYIDTEEFKQKYEDRPYAIIDSVFLDEFNRKVILTDLILEIDTFHFKLKFIEGVGPNASPFIYESNGLFWGMSNIFLCTYKDNVLAYTNTEVGGECTYKKPVSNRSIQSSPKVIISFYNNIINLTFEDSFSGNICLFTPEGKIVQKVNIHKNSNSINIQHIPDGIYIVSITDSSGKFRRSEKIFKRSL